MATAFKLPDYVAERFAEKGVNVKKLLWAANGDMDKEHVYIETWLAFDKVNVYYLTGTLKNIPGKKKVALQRILETKTFEVRPVSDYGRLYVERMIATGLLVSEKDEEHEILAVFSLGRSVSFENFAKYYNMNFTESKDEDPPVAEREKYCPTCGLRYPDPRRPICPKCMDKFSVVSRLLQMFKPYIHNVIIISIFMVITTLIGLVTPFVSAAVLYDNILSIKPLKLFGHEYYLFGYVALFVFLIIGLRVASMIIGILQTRFMSSVVPRVVYDIKMMVFESMQRLSVSFYTSKQTGSLMTRVNGDASYIQWFFVDGIPYILNNALTFIGVLTALLIMNWKLTLFVCFAVPIIVGIYILLWSFFNKKYHARWVYASRMYSLLSDALYGQRVIKALSKEDEENNRFTDYSETVNHTDTNIGVMSSTVFPFAGLSMVLVQCVIMAWSGILIVTNDPTMSLGNMILFGSYTGMLYGPLMNFQTFVSWWGSAASATQRIFEIIDAQSDVPEAASPVSMKNMKGDFEAHDVFFEYESGRPVIRNLSIDIKAGQMLGIVGRTGSGKSTLVNLLARLYDPKGGFIKLDGIDLREIATKDLRKNIGIVSQDIYLFIGTIADNIRYARPDAPMEEVIAAAKAASAHDFIMKMPDGYETLIGASGQGLSGGERQRVSIARAVIQNPRVLILDEATAAMDTETERNIQESLAQLQNGRTVISIAHRLSTLRDADVLAVIDKGKVVEYGTHTELIGIEDGVYRKLYTLQMEALKFIGIGE